MNEISVFCTALLIWLGFTVPIIAGGVMWNNEPKKIAFQKFLIQAGYQLILFIIFTLILSAWR
jgi:CRISPR/Cas system-associated protein endoribonuclease Cas2